MAAVETGELPAATWAGLVPLQPDNINKLRLANAHYTQRRFIHLTFRSSRLSVQTDVYTSCPVNGGVVGFVMKPEPSYNTYIATIGRSIR